VVLGFSGGSIFTLVELLVVIAIIAILASMLLPALSSVRAKAQGVACAGNIRSINLAVGMYINDFSDNIPQAYNGGMQASWHQVTYLYIGTGATNVVLSQAQVNARKMVCQTATANHRAYQDAWNTGKLYNAGLAYTCYGLNQYAGGWCGTFYSNAAKAMDADYHARFIRIAQPGMMLMIGETSAGFDGYGYAFGYQGFTNAGSGTNRLASNLEWLHSQSANYGFADGHSEQLTFPRIRLEIQANYSIATKRLASNFDNMTY